MTSDMALCLSHFLGTRVGFWLNLQELYEQRRAENDSQLSWSRTVTASCPTSTKSVANSPGRFSSSFNRIESLYTPSGITRSLAKSAA